jgi:hypothetical protein
MAKKNKTTLANSSKQNNIDNEFNKELFQLELPQGLLDAIHNKAEKGNISAGEYLSIWIMERIYEMAEAHIKKSL